MRLAVIGPRFVGRGFSVGVRLAVGVCVLFVALFMTTASAAASFPGRNGKIVYALNGSDKYARSPSSIRTVSPRSGAVQVLQNCAGVPEPPCDLGRPRFSPDGLRIAFPKLYIAYPPGQALQYQHGLGSTAANGSMFEFRTATPQSLLAWSPAGNELLVQRSVDPFTVSIVSLDGRELRQVAPAGLEVVPRAADWASTGRIAFEARPQGATCPPACSGDIYAMTEGGMPRRLTFRGGESPSWSPHASKLAFVRRARPEQQGNIYIVRSRGRGLRRLTRRGGEAPAWSPDGKRLAFIRDGDLYVIRTDGTRKRRLVDEQLDGYGGPLQAPDWQPRPRP